ncbi:MAG: hypothetical protein COA57_10175 [Flavobacteriales bacterium]|nr:MAG: hypothetical protein COA57_10175 [Flavobacteriales bacterium]
MIHKHHIFIIYFLLNASLVAQNLVPNPSFEDRDCCPVDFAQGNVNLPPCVLDWKTEGPKIICILDPSPGTTDYLNTCDYSTGTPLTGDGYIGIILSANRGDDYREYITVDLNAPLIIGDDYFVEFFVNAQNIGGESDRVGAAFTKNRPKKCDVFEPLPLNPQITNPLGNIILQANGWTRVAGTFSSNEEFEWITIGNFFDDNNTTITDNVIAYYFIDDVTVMSVCDAGCVNGCSRTDGATSITFNTNVNQNQPFRVLGLDNVSSATLEIFTSPDKSISTRIFITTVNCPNGITQILEWDGTDVNGFHLPVQQYYHRLTVFNDCGRCTLEGTITKTANYTEGMDLISCSSITTPDPCCKAQPDIFIDNVTYPSGEEFEYHAVNSVNVATQGTGRVTVSTGSTVTYKAGSIIAFGQGFSAEPSSNFSAFIEPCLACKVGDTTSIDKGKIVAEEPENLTEPQIEEPESVVAQEPAFQISPNPTAGKFEVRNTKHETGNWTVEVYSVLGERAYFNNSVTNELITVDLSSHPKGIYFVKVVCENLPQQECVYIEKLVKQ